MALEVAVSYVSVSCVYLLVYFSLFSSISPSTYMVAWVLLCASLLLVGSSLRHPTPGHWVCVSSPPPMSVALVVIIYNITIAIPLCVPPGLTVWASLSRLITHQYEHQLEDYNYL